MNNPKSVLSRLRSQLTAGLATLFLLTSVQQAHATSGYLSTWRSLYPASTSDNASCQLCHGSSTQNINPYGHDMAQCNGKTGTITQRIQAAEGLNSDGDAGGYTNLEEINANTQPGWTTGSMSLWGRNNCANAGSETDPTGLPLDPSANMPPVADANGPYNGTAGLQVTFDGSGSNDPDGTITAYNWTFGDGGNGTGVNPVHTYANAGTYTVTLMVTDDGGATGSATSTATIVAAPQDPIADPNGPYNGFEGVALTLNGSASFDPDGGVITQYLWNFGDGNTGTGVAPSHTYANAGTYTVTLTVVDDEGAQSAPASTTAVIDIPPANIPPTADPNGPYTGTTGQSVSFDGSGSSDPDGSIASYSWNFGDGGTGTGVNPVHSYAAAGNYSVTLTVTDNEGATSAPVSTTANISDAPAPVACNGELDIDRASWSTWRDRLRVEGDRGQEDAGDFVLLNAYSMEVLATGGSESDDRQFDFRVSNLDPVPCVVRVEQPGSGRCDIREVSNAPADCAPKAPMPDNLPPVSDPDGPYNGAAGEPVQFDGTGSSDPDGNIVAYAWDFGDGNTGDGATPTHTYAAAGSYTVSLTVTDNDGAADTATTLAVIDEQPQAGGVTARGDTYATPVGNTLTIKASRVSGVLYNDFGGEPPLTAELVNGPAAGSLDAFGADGSFTYTPGGTMTDNKIDTFTYVAVDALGNTSAEATVVIQALSKQTDFKIMMNYELGMHCTGFEFAYCCVLPPYNSILAQVIKPAQNDPACAQDEHGCGSFFDGYPRLLQGDPNAGLDGLNRETVVRDWDYTTSQFKKYQLRYYHDAQPRQEGNTSKPNASTLISDAEGKSLQYFNTLFDSAQPDGNNALVYGTYSNIPGVVQGSGVIGDVPTDNYANGWLNHFYIYGNLEGHGATGLEADKMRLGVAGQVEYPANSGASLQPLGPTGNGTSFENVLTFSGDTGTVVFTQSKVLEDLPIMLTSPRIWEALGMPLTPFEDTIGFFGDPGAVDEDAVRPFVAMKASLHEYPSGNEVIGSNGEPVIGFGTAPIDIPNCERCHSAPSINPDTGMANVNSPNYNRPDATYPHGGPLAGTGLEDLTNMEINFWLAYYDIVPGVDSDWYPRLKGAAINMLTLHDYDVGTSFTGNYAGTECVDPDNCVGGPLTNESDIPQNTRLGKESVICQKCHADNVIAVVKSAGTENWVIPPITEAIHNQHRNASEGGVIVFNDSLGRDGGCQGCHPAHRSDGVMDDYPITLGGNNVNADGDNRLNLGGCFVGRDVHSNPMKDVDGAETAEHLNAVGEYLQANVSYDQGEQRGIWCTNCHTQLGQELWRTEDCNDLIRGDCLVNPRAEPTLADVAAAVGLTEQEAIDMIDPKNDPLNPTAFDPSDTTHKIWDPGTPDADVATIEVDANGPVLTFDADGDPSVNILSFCTTEDCVNRINNNPTDQSQWRYPANPFIDPINNSAMAVPFNAATDGRDHWLAAGEPHCADCHKAPYVEQSGNISPYPPFNYPAKASLMRYTRGHQDISCQGCHESIHGLYPVTPAIDTTTYAQAAALNNDGSHGPLKCATCHTFVDGNGIPNWVDNLRYNDPTTSGNDNLPVAGNFDRAVSWMHTYTAEANPVQDVCRNCHGSETPEVDDDEYLEHAMTNRVSRVAMDNAERAVNNGRVFGELPGQQRNRLCSECHEERENKLDEVSCDRDWRRHLIQGRVAQVVWEDVSKDRTGGTCGW